MENTLQKRCIKFLSTFRTPISQFCSMTNISRSAYYRWLSGDLNLSKKTENRISSFLLSFGY